MDLLLALLGAVVRMLGAVLFEVLPDLLVMLMPAGRRRKRRARGGDETVG